jgi:5-methylcytosine-specific restriction endonuclease McrA
VEAAGLIPHDCGNGHWQIRGGKYCVNFYPHAKDGPSFYVNATNAGVKTKYSRHAERRVTIADAIEATYNPLHKRRIKKTPRRRSYRGAKKRLLADDPRCYWCKKPLDASTATLDHIIPLSKGGTNGIDNLTLACEDCNQSRDNELPAQTEWEKLSNLP